MAEPTAHAGPVQNLHRLHKKLESSPLIWGTLGILSIGLWLTGTVTQIQTSEYLAQGQHLQVSGVAWGILMQPWLLLSGQAPIQLATSWQYAWTVEVVTLIFAMALSVAVDKIASVSPRLAKFFVVVGLPLILLNSWADYSSSPGPNPLIQVLMAAAIGGFVVVGLPLGVGLIEHAIGEF